MTWDLSHINLCCDECRWYSVEHWMYVLFQGATNIHELHGNYFSREWYFSRECMERTALHWWDQLYCQQEEDCWIGRKCPLNQAYLQSFWIYIHTLQWLGIASVEYGPNYCWNVKLTGKFSSWGKLIHWDDMFWYNSFQLELPGQQPMTDFRGWALACWHHTDMWCHFWWKS